MNTSNASKSVLNFSVALSIVILSLSIFIYSLKHNPANAQNPANDQLTKINKLPTKDGCVPVGVVMTNNTICRVIGYCAKDGSIKILAEKNIGYSGY